jgi:hypothetical protein
MKKVDTYKGRLYTAPDGSELWSVTTKLNILAKPQLVAWAAKMEREFVLEAATDLFSEAPAELSPPSFRLILEQRLGSKKAHQKELERASGIGNQVHHYIENELGGRLGRPPKEVEKLVPEAVVAFAKWQDWEREREFEPIHLEQQVYSLVHGYAGTLDMIARYTRQDGKKVLALVDWKTSSGIYLEYLLQIGAYHAAIREMGHFRDEELDGLIVKIPKSKDDTEVRVVELPHLDIVERYIPAFLKVNAVFDAVKELEIELSSLVGKNKKEKENVGSGNKGGRQEVAVGDGGESDPVY